MDEKTKFINLNVQTHMSIGESALRISDLIEFCKKNNIPYAAFCDRSNFFGSVEYSNYLIKNNIKPIIGCMIKIHNFGYLPCFIKSKLGFRNLSNLISLPYIKEDTAVHFNDLVKFKDEIIILSGGIDSVFYEGISLDEIEKKIKQLYEVFKDNLYIQIINSAGKFNLIQIAEKLNIPIVIAPTVKCIDEKQQETLYALEKVNANQIFTDDELAQFKQQKNYYMKYDEIIKEYSFLGPLLDEGLENTIQIAKRCSFYITQEKPSLPVYISPDTEEEALKKLAYAGLKKRLLNVDIDKHETYWKRLNFELDVIILKKFARYFLCTADFMKYATDNDIPVGLGRGSGAGSLVAYSLKITGIDPIKFGLIFERFLNPERNSFPDFDIDFDPERREEIVKYLMKKYGIYRVANIITFGKFHARGAIRAVCRIFNIPFKQSDELTKLIPNDQVNPLDLKQSIELVPNLKVFSESEKFKRIFELSLGIEGLVYSLSQHAAGIIITNENIFEQCGPLMKFEKDERFVTQLDFKSLDQVGGIKFDFLCLRTLSIIKYITNLIEKNYGIIINTEKIPLDDAKTFKLFCNKNLEGVFQFENAGIIEYVGQLAPNNIEDLIALNALYRPGPIKNIPLYIHRKNKKEPIKYLHPMLEPILKDTFGVIVYQEQVIYIVMQLASYSLGKADLVRWIMGKKKVLEMQQQRAQFVKGSMENGIEEKTANDIFDQISEFSGYGFNKSHAAPYAIIAYFCGYFKANYPLEFFCACCSLEMDNDKKLLQYINNARQMGFDVIPPCVNKSLNHFSIENGKLQYGIGALKGIGVGLAEHFEKDRQENGLYTGIYNFIGRNSDYVNLKNWKSLVNSGFFDVLEPNRNILIDSLELIRRGDQLPIKEKKSRWQNLLESKASFGFYLQNPLQEYRNLLLSLNCVTIKNLNNLSEFIAGEIFNIRRRRTKTNKNYAFVQISDETALIDVILFDKVLSDNSNKIKEGELMIFKVRLKQEGKSRKILITSVYSINEFLDFFSKKIYLEFDFSKQLIATKKILDKHPSGNCVIFFKIGTTFYALDQKICDSIELREELTELGIAIYTEELKFS